MKKIIFLILVIIAVMAVACYAQEGGSVMKITSPAFKNNELMPAKYTCDGEDISPPLGIENIPDGTKTLALICDDPDAPVGNWVHWVVFDIEVVGEIKENSIPGKQGINDFRRKNYGGPCPPSGTHRYFFKIYALDTKLGLNEGISKKELEKSMKAHIMQEAQLVGLYKRR